MLSHKKELQNQPRLILLMQIRILEPKKKK